MINHCRQFGCLERIKTIGIEACVKSGLLLFPYRSRYEKFRRHDPCALERSARGFVIELLSARVSHNTIEVASRMWGWWSVDLEKGVPSGFKTARPGPAHTRTIRELSVAANIGL